MSATYFWDRHAAEYAKKPIADPTAYEEKLTRVRSLLRATDHVLEIGCGTGSTARRLAPVVAQITATDVSSEMIRIALSKLASIARATSAAPTNVVYRQADATDLADGHPFDVICAFSLLHLVIDVRVVLNRVRKQLKPGGLFVSKTVCLKDRSRLIQMMVRTLTAVGLAPHVTAFSRNELIDRLLEAGFEIEQITYFGEQRMSPFIVARRTAA